MSRTTPDAADEHILPEDVVAEEAEVTEPEEEGEAVPAQRSGLPDEANEADVLEQWEDVGDDEEDEPRDV